VISYGHKTELDNRPPQNFQQREPSPMESGKNKAMMPLSQMDINELEELQRRHEQEKLSVAQLQYNLQTAGQC